MYSLTRTQVLADRNKRLNGRDIRYHPDGAEKLVLAVAAGELDLPEIARWLDAHLIEAEPHQ